MRILLLAFAFVVGCSADGETTGSQGGSGSGGSQGQGGGLNLGGSGASGNGPSCSEAATLVYLLSDFDELYSFHPAERTFTKIGVLGCPTALQPNSMAIDRNATAWVNYVDASDATGAVFRVDTSDASCEPTPVVDLPEGWRRMGMGFSSDEPGSAEETLYVTSVGFGQGKGLGRIDMTTSSVIPIAPFAGAVAGEDAELTGTGDARLFAFLTSAPVAVAELDKTTAAVLSHVPLPTVDVPNAWAFSFWGGEFYLYTSTGQNSRVNRYSPSDGSVDTSYVLDAGFRIVGAGVSTCAPVEPPK